MKQNVKTISGRKETTDQPKKKTKVEEYVVNPDKVLKFTRGTRVKTKNIKDRRLKSRLKSHEKKYEAAIKQAARSELLKTEEAGYLEAEGLERTHQFKQKDIVESLDISSAQRYFDLKLEQLGSYKINYTKHGKFMLIGGHKGHLATIDWISKNLGCEIYVQETVRDVTWLHQETLFATAQKKYVYIYDNQGTEIHCLKEHREVNRLEYLPYHFLLTTVGNHGNLKYQDTSTGKLVSSLKTRLGRCDCMTQNPYNAVIQLGHHNGCVTMWSPVMKDPLVKMLCHRGPVLSIAVERQGVYMATSGTDGLMKVWDIRAFKPVYKYRMKGRPAHCLAISQRGMLAAAFGPQVYVFKDALREKQSMPYLKHVLPGASISSIRFCPYEDVLGIGHSKGISSILVPGAGEPNFDGFEDNPFETKKQRQEHEVKMLLQKIQPEMISLNPSDVLKLDTALSDVRKAERDEGKEEEVFAPKYKKKGKSSSSKCVQRKKGVGEQSKRDQLKANALKEKKKDYEKLLKKQNMKDEEPPFNEFSSALDRFKQKR